MKKAIYEELADQLLRRILSGAFPDGKLPSMSSLVEEYKVNLQTANRAVKVLEQKGIVKCHVGKGGTRINAARAHLISSASQSHFSVDQALSGRPQVRLRFLFDVTLLQKSFETAAELFSKRYPWIRIDLIPTLNIHQSIADGIAFDVLMLIGRDVSQYVRRNLFRDLTGILAAEEWRREEFIAHVWDQNIWQEHCYAVPFSWTLPVLLFHRGEISPPATWSAFSRLLHTPSKEKEARIRIGFYTLLHTAGGIPGTRPEAESRAATRELLDCLKALCIHLPRGHYLWNNPNDNDKSALEKNSMFCMNFSGMESFLKSPHPDWEIAPLPREKGGKIVLSTEALAIAQKSEFPAESWLWSKFLLRDEVRSLFHVPSCLSPKISTFRKCGLPQAVTSLLEKEAENAVAPSFSSCGMFRFYSCIFPFLERYFSGFADADETLDRIHEFLKEQRILDLSF